MKKLWKDIKIGDKFKDGSVVKQIHRTHNQSSCKVIYDTDKTFICSLNHILLIDISKLPIKGKEELNKYCTFVPLEENFIIDSNSELSIFEKHIIDRYCHNEQIDIKVDIIEDDEIEILDFYFKDGIKRIYIKTEIIKSESQKVDENTFWLSCYGIDYLMKKYNAPLYCNKLLINKIEPLGDLPCFCISTDSGKYEI